MRARLLFPFLLFFCALSAYLPAPTPYLKHSDVRTVMNQFFDYHIDQKEMTNEILERSLKVYITQFDPCSSYLLASDVQSYVLPSASLLKTMKREYDADRLTTYFALNMTIQKSIARARAWRSDWQRDPKALIAEAKNLSKSDSEDDSFVKTLGELKERHRKQFVKYLALQMRQLPQKAASKKEEKLVALCEKQIRLIENSYLGFDEDGNPLSQVEYEHQVTLRVLKSLAHSLDSHTAYYSPDEAFAMKVQLEKGMCGIGVVLHESIEGVCVADMIRGGPAEKCGKLQVGDTIVEVNGESVRDYSFQRILEVLRGGEGTKAVLGVVRHLDEGKEQIVRVELIRSKITIEDKRVDVSHEPFGDGIIGKITLYSFYEGEEGLSSEKDLKLAIDQLRAIGPLYGLVLDMRDNCGGFLSQSVRVSGLFISSGVVVVSKYSDGTMKYYRTVDGSRYFDGPLVVLISKGSASATEIVAQALQDYGVAVVVGDAQTYGKGTIQHQTVTNDRCKSFFKVTIGRYYTPSGKSTQIDGVKADIVVPTAMNFQDVGESYLDFPLPADCIESCLEDPLSDIDPYARKWFAKYYLPKLQPKVGTWQEKLALLRENSRTRLDANPNFQCFLQKVNNQCEVKQAGDPGCNDLQMEESVNILKDMIFLQMARD